MPRFKSSKSTDKSQNFLWRKLDRGVRVPYSVVFFTIYTMHNLYSNNWLNFWQSVNSAWIKILSAEKCKTVGPKFCLVNWIEQKIRINAEWVSFKPEIHFVLQVLKSKTIQTKWDRVVLYEKFWLIAFSLKIIKYTGT